MRVTGRFLMEFLRPRPGAVVEEETEYGRNGQTLPATLYRPRREKRALPGWVPLHGLTFQGRHHPSLRRLARALAASGSAVLVPDLPEWRALRIAPGPTVQTIKAAVLTLDGLGITAPGRIGVIGFSFGATQSLMAATDPVLDGHLAGIAAWGGYADIGTASRFAFLGEHELDGRTYRLEPDPYGRWILGGNYLRLIADDPAMEGVADALLQLALEAGRMKVMSWEPFMDPVKVRIREPLDLRQRELFDLIAPPTGHALDPSRRRQVAELVDRLLAAATAADPLLDPGPYLGRVPVPVFLAHGRGDRLIPWTEMIRLRRALPPAGVVSAGITSLFSHSRGERRVPTFAAGIEAIRFARLMHRMLHLI